MTTKKILISITALSFLLSCNTSKINTNSTNNDKATNYIDGYFSKNTLQFNENVKNLVFTNKEDFDQYFGVAKTMNNTIEEPDFNQYNYAAIITKPSTKKQLISITNMAENKNQFTVNYTTSEQGTQSFQSNDVKIFRIPKGIEKVNFNSNEGSQIINVTDMNESEVPLSYLNGYFSKNDVTFNQNVKEIIVTNTNDFDRYFGVAKTMQNTITPVDFNSHNYAAIITKPSAQKQLITITNIVENKDQLTVNYKIIKQGTQSFQSNDVKIFEISKMINTVLFISDTNSNLIKIKK